jgi:hypothetical protein
MIHRKAPSVLLGLIVLGGAGYLAHAGMNLNANRKVPYSGYLEMNGAAAPSGEYEVNFGLYTSAGGDDSCLTTDPTACGVWGESQTMTVSAGRFSVVLGDGTGDTLNDAVIETDRLYVGMAVKGPADLDFVLLGKQEIVPVPLAARAAAANNYKVRGNLTVGGTAAITGDTSITGNTSIDGDLAAAGDVWAQTGFIGDVGHAASWVAVAHEDQATTTGYGLLLNSDGRTILNAGTGQALRLRQGNSDRLTMNASGNWTATGSLSAAGALSSGTSVSAPTASFTDGDVSGNASSGGARAPGGELQFRWGSVTSTSDADQAFSFSSAFPTGCLFATVNRARGEHTSDMSAKSCNASSVTVNRDNGIDGSEALTYFAIGY